ncbi:hypothetical protein [Allocoleopsis sp.]|uniref:hypothetical protein n=1 Tax=Allocoleopsis sp. TaxID=3088169 RepID=UPI002FD39177
MPLSNLPQLKQGTETLLRDIQWQAGITFIIYGLRIGIRVNEPSVLELLTNYLPPQWEPSVSPIVDKLYSLIVAGNSPHHNRSNRYHRLYDEQAELTRTQELEEIFEILDSELRLWVGVSVQHRLFVHAGVVGWRGRAIVIPGRSFSGKTTLVAALVKAGATYYSDEYAVFDTEGLVHPYPRPLSIRQQGGERTKRCSVEELGGQAGKDVIPVGLIINTRYQPKGQWCPSPISSGQAVLALLDNTLVARLRPEFALPILSRAVSGVLALEGERGETQDVAVALLQQLDALIA